MAHAARMLARATGATSRDLTHRIYGTLAESGNLFRCEEISDDVLTDRVRARIGRSVSHPHAISVTVNDGHVSLSGPVLAHEAPRLLSGVSSVRGVKGVENALTVHTEAENISSLQGGRPRTGDRFALMQTNWSPTARLLAGLAGGALMANCLARRSLLGAPLGAVGAGLLMRSATNMDMKSLRRRSRPPTDQGAEDDQHPCAGRTSLRFFDRSPEFSARYVQRARGATHGR